MKVLSLFDGMSCGRIALREFGITPETYYASEIDRHAIAQTQYNFPDTVQLGDVTRWREWDIDWEHIDLVMGGSPCQGFSFAGKQLAFDDPRSRLFFVFAETLTHARRCNPGVKFFLENVNMKKEHMRVISQYVGVFPVNINSALVSAQNRNRWYWTDIRTRREGLFGDVYSDIPQPEDRGIMLKDILETEVDEKYYLSDKSVLNLLAHKERHEAAGHGFGAVFHDVNGNMQALKTGGKGFDDLIMMQRPRGYNQGGFHTKKSPILSSNAWEQNNMVIQLNPSKESGGIQPYQQNRVYDPAGKSPALMAEMSCGTHAILDNTKINVLGNIYDNGHNSQAGRVYDTSGKSTSLRGETGGIGSKTGLYLTGARIRRLTPIECARLQTIPEWYRWACSETQQYKMLGNGWTIEVIKHILSYGKWN